MRGVPDQLIRRDRDTADRRKVIVSLNSAEQRTRVDPDHAGQAAQMLHLLDRYDDEALAVIADFLKTVADGSWPVTSSAPH